MAEKSNPLNKVEPLVNSIMGVQTEDVKQRRASEAAASKAIDWSALGTYVGGTAVQMGAMIAALGLLQLTTQGLPSRVQVGIAIVFFILVSIRSRVFSPLNNARTRTTYSNVSRPGWAPPPLAFPIIWMSIGVLRVIASYLVWQALGQSYLSLPLVLFMVHLALGDTWNTIFTVEGRLGAAVPMVLVGPLLSAVVVVFAYWQTVALAGQLLLPMVIWLGVASALVIAIWQLNGAEPMYPLKLDDSTLS
ncbi:TspO/MBR family protein [Leptothoe kymatousa]|uniref:Tryptophan-rich sensory protein n=1 Tax=Leptothoe kymatousa TAU-MAC 1615 TaxID=2364775 RepID=A0ABS5XZG3_9CYAN|nr:tryptophan-rich sensory protein [Leptothoe kymatousa]MBT9310985.1 tryptophan-rich sensory protein [Leptothoe kymatousa TAU-MAC 1615]